MKYSRRFKRAKWLNAANIPWTEPSVLANINSDHYHHATSQKKFVENKLQFIKYVHDLSKVSAVDVDDYTKEQHDVIPQRYTSNYVVMPGLNNANASNIYVNSKSAGIVHMPVHYRTSSTNSVATWYRPTADSGDSHNMNDATYYFAMGGINSPNTGTYFSASRPIGCKVRISFQGAPSTTNGSLYLAFPSPHEAFQGTTGTNLTFGQFFGEVDQVVASTTSIAASGQFTGRDTHTITLSKLAELGTIEFTILNELTMDKVFRALDNATTDPLEEIQFGGSSIGLLWWCDSNSITDKLRFEVTHFMEVCTRQDYIQVMGTAKEKMGINSKTPHPGFSHIRSVVNHVSKKSPLQSAAANAARVATVVKDAARSSMDWAKTGRRYGGPIGGLVGGLAGAGYGAFKGFTSSGPVSTSTGRVREVDAGNRLQVSFPARVKAKGTPEFNNIARRAVAKAIYKARRGIPL